MKQRIKNAFAMSVETIVVITIMVIVLAIAVASTKSIKDQYTAYKTVKEVKSYTNAILQFKLIYGYWPGGVPVDKMVGDLYDKQLIDDINSIQNNGP